MKKSSMLEFKKRKPSGLPFYIILKFRNFSLQLFFPKIKAHQEGRGKNEDCKKDFKEIFHLDLPL